MADADSTLKILIDIRAKLDELSAAKRGFAETRKEADSFGALLKQGLGIGSGMELARRGVDLLRESIFGAFEGAQKLAREIKQNADDMGFSGEAYQVFKNELKDAGVEMGRLSNAVSTQSLSLAAARDGVGAAAKAYRDLNLAASEVESLAADERVLAVARATLNATDQTKAFAAAGQILGTRGLPSLLGALKNLASEGYGSLSQEMIKSGKIMTDQNAEMLRQNEKQLEALKLRRDVAAGEAMGFFTLLGQAAADNPLAVLKATFAFDTDGPKGLAALLANYMPKVEPPAKAPPAGPADDEARILARLLSAKQEYERVSNRVTQTDIQKRPELLAALREQEEAQQALIDLKFSDLNAVDKNGKLVINQALAEGKITEEQLNRLQEKWKIEAEINKLRSEQADKEGRAPSAGFRIGEAYKGINNPKENGNYLSASEGFTAGLQSWAVQAGSVGQQIAAGMQSTVGAQISNLSQGLVGLITKTQSWGDVGRSAGLSFLNILMQTGLQMAASALITKGLTALHLTSESAKTAATVAGSAVRKGVLLAEAAAVSLASGVASVFHSIMELGPIAGPLVFAASVAGMIALVKGLAGRELGGPVSKGVPYIVGEKRAEVFVPDSNGTIVPSLDQYASTSSRGLAYANTATVKAGSTGAGTVTARSRQVIFYTGNLIEAKQMARNPEYESVIVDIVQRRRGEILGG